MVSSNSSNSSKGEGNTKPPPCKQISPCIRWCFTLNNYVESELNLFSSIVPAKCKKFIAGFEVGENGTPHLQGYLEFKTKARPKSVFSCERIHWEKAGGTALENFKYCCKESNIFMNIGFPRPLKKLICEDPEKRFPWQNEILKIIEKEPDDRTIHWFYSEDGGRGKTTFCKYLTRKYGAICLGGKAADMKHGIVSYKQNHGFCPELIVCNISKSFDPNYLSYGGIEECKDMYFHSGKYEGDMIDGNCPHLIIFCNFYPDTSKMMKGRWFIRKINSEDQLVKVKSTDN
jgi:hypothetical protein